MSRKDDELKLIYVLKIGKNSKNEYIYEFLFSKKSDQVTDQEIEDWNWDMKPAIEYKNLLVPSKDFIDKTISLTTKDFILTCLHDSIDRPYIHGFHLIHALAYEDDDAPELDDDENNYDDDYESMFEDDEIEKTDDLPLVFHYNMTINDVKEALYSKNIILKGDKFMNGDSVEIL